MRSSRAVGTTFSDFLCFADLVGAPSIVERVLGINSETSYATGLFFSLA